MINVLRYEPRGQRQRFEPQIQRHREEQGRHLHLHLNVHIHLNLGARGWRGRRFLQPTVMRVTTIFAAFMGALSMALSFTVMSSTTFPFVGPHIALAGQIMFIGALMASSAVLFGGLPLVIQTWRSTPRSRLLLSVPLLIFLIALTSMGGFVNLPLLLAELLFVAAIWRPTWRKRFLKPEGLIALIILMIPLTSLLASGIWQWFRFLSPWMSGNTANILLALLFYGIPLVSTIAIVRAVRQAKLSDRVLRFTTLPSVLVAGGLLLMIAGMLVWAGTVLVFLPSIFPQILGLLTLPLNSWLLQFIGMLIALVVMLQALFSHSHGHMEARPKEASSFDVDSSRERGYYPVDGNQEEKSQGERS